MRRGISNMMNQRATFPLNERPKGIQKIRALPDAALGDLWDSIILDRTLKSSLMSQAGLNFTCAPKFRAPLSRCTASSC